MSTIQPERSLPYTGTFTNANKTTASQKSEQATRSSFCQRLRAALRAVVNTTLRFIPCLPAKKVEKTGCSPISKEETYAHIKETLLNKVAENDVKGIFRMSVAHESLQKIQENKVEYGFVKELAMNKKENVVHLYANLLKENLKVATEKLSYEDMKEIESSAGNNMRIDIRKKVLSKMEFASKEDEKEFSTSMDIIADIYHALKSKPCDEAPPEGIARIISPLICDPTRLNQNTGAIDVSETVKQSKEAGELTRFVLDNWDPQRAKLSILQES